MTIVLCGGGSGGHITPLLAVAREIKRQKSDCRVIIISEKAGKFRHLIESETSIDERYYISAGKFRRYHGQSLFSKLIDIKTLLLNIRDFFRFLLGYWQSRGLIKRINPDVVFIKGGFVGVPVGLASARRQLPIVTHDSDTIPGLANRIVARWAKIHATGMPSELYSYPQELVRYTGVPISDSYKYVDDIQLNKARQQLSIPSDALVVFVTGGSQGAKSLNQLVVSQYKNTLEMSAKIIILHQVGEGNISKTKVPSRVHQYEFLKDMSIYSAAADVVVGRASATTITEFGVQCKPVILIPAKFLAGGHQTKNAQYFSDHQAAVVVNEDNPNQLYKELHSLFKNQSQRTLISKNLHNLIKKDAAKNIATLLIKTADGTSKG